MGSWFIWLFWAVYGWLWFGCGWFCEFEGVYCLRCFVGWCVRFRVSLIVCGVCMLVGGVAFGFWWCSCGRSWLNFVVC